MISALSGMSGVDPSSGDIPCVTEGEEFRGNGTLQFEALLGAITARFINLPADQIDTVIEDAQRLFCEGLDLDRSALYQFSDDGDLLLTHLHQPADGPSNQKRYDPSSRLTVYWAEVNDTPRTYVRLNVKTHFPWIYERIRRGETTVLSSLEEFPEEAHQDKQALARYGAKSTVIIPLLIGGVSMGCLTFAAMREYRDWSERLVTRFQAIANVFANALARKRADTERKRVEAELRQSLEEVKRLQEQLHAENVYLRKEVRVLQSQTHIVGEGKSLRRTMLQAQQVAPTDSTVLILGETGTGKGLLAQHIHAISGRSAKPFVTANIAALPATLVESEVFGREKGAYTGALTSLVGRFEMADGGTIFLDEIAEMPLETQVKLLRVLQSGEFERLGSSESIRVNVRVIAATNRDLQQLMRAGKFRQDMYYRLNVFPIALPPLRDRPEDIPLLVEAFVRELAVSMGKPIERIRKKDLEALQNYGWPGNVRELRNVVERCMILARGTELQLIPPEVDTSMEASGSRLLRDVEKRHILQVIRSTGGKISGSGGAAGILGIKPTTLYSMMARLGIDRASALRPATDGSPPDARAAG